MYFTDNALNILTTKTYKGIGRAWIAKKLRGNELIEEIVDLLNQNNRNGTVTSMREFERRKGTIYAQLEQLDGFIDGLVAIGDSNFPAHRGLVKDSEKPVALFYRGDLSLLQRQNQTTAVIGLINPDEDTEIFERNVVDSLVSQGSTILSGLALGCDTIAHRQALLSGGETIAILPSPVFDVLPKVNNELAEEIVQNRGLLISEYYEKPNSTKELKGRYIERDRLQALFSDCVLLVASYAENNLGNDSGARHAMNYALNYSIPRAIIYDPELNSNNPKYDLNRQLLKQDSKIISISRNNLQNALEEILSKCSQFSGENWIQAELFR